MPRQAAEILLIAFQSHLLPSVESHVWRAASVRPWRPERGVGIACRTGLRRMALGPLCHAACHGGRGHVFQDLFLYGQDHQNEVLGARKWPCEALYWAFQRLLKSNARARRRSISSRDARRSTACKRRSASETHLSLCTPPYLESYYVIFSAL